MFDAPEVVEVAVISNGACVVSTDGVTTAPSVTLIDCPDMLGCT